jgi:hypothetical protein
MGSPDFRIWVTAVIGVSGLSVSKKPAGRRRYGKGRILAQCFYQLFHQDDVVDVEEKRKQNKEKCCAKNEFLERRFGFLGRRVLHDMPRCE